MSDNSVRVCLACRGRRVIYTDRPGATSPRPCPACLGPARSRGSTATWLVVSTYCDGDRIVEVERLTRGGAEEAAEIIRRHREDQDEMPKITVEEGPLRTVRLHAASR